MRDTENNAKTEPKKEKIRKEIDKVKENIAKQREKYLKVVSLHKELEVKYAYIVFRSMEGCQRALFAYN